MNPKEIKDLRIKIGLNQTDFGRLVQAERRLVSHWESGNSRPNKFHLALLRHVEANYRKGVYTDDAISQFQMAGVMGDD